MGKIKKILPKIKKKLSDFLTDESGKITKKDALGISAWAVAFAALSDITSAGHNGHTSGYNLANHQSGYSVGHQSGTRIGSHQSGTRIGGAVSGFTSASCPHGSGIINGHYSNTPTASPAGHASGYAAGAHQSGYAAGAHQNGYYITGHRSGYGVSHLSHGSY